MLGQPLQERLRAVQTSLRSPRWYLRLQDLVAIPQLTLAFLSDSATGGHYQLSWPTRLRLVWKMYRNGEHIQTGTSFRAHVAMASRILSIPPRVEGCLVECGAWKGGTTANLSLVAALVDRKLVVYDSFEGLPAPADGDNWAGELGTGAFRGDLQEVRDNIAAYGALEVCEFRAGWFNETLPQHDEPIIFIYLDVDYQDSLNDCVLYLWPHLTERGWVFIDEYIRLDFCALFFSEQWWARHFDRPPPGLLGAGTGVGVGQFYRGPWQGRGRHERASSAAATRKDFYALWDFTPADGEPWSVSYDRADWKTTAPTVEEIERTALARVLNEDGTPRNAPG